MNREQLIEEIHEMFDGFTLKEQAIERFMSAVDKYSQHQTEALKKEIEELKKKRISVKIGLHQDAMSPNIQCLMFQNNNGGYRLTKSKGCGSWNELKEFDCSFTLEELENYSTPPKQ